MSLGSAMITIDFNSGVATRKLQSFALNAETILKPLSQARVISVDTTSAKAKLATLTKAFAGFGEKTIKVEVQAGTSLTTIKAIVSQLDRLRTLTKTSFTAILKVNDTASKTAIQEFKTLLASVPKTITLYINGTQARQELGKIRSGIVGVRDFNIKISIAAPTVVATLVKVKTALAEIQGLQKLFNIEINFTTNNATISSQINRIRLALSKLNAAGTSNIFTIEFIIIGDTAKLQTVTTNLQAAVAALLRLRGSGIGGGGGGAGTGGGSSGPTADLIARLKTANALYDRGQIDLIAYNKELRGIQTSASIANRGLASTSAEGATLNRIMAQTKAALLGLTNGTSETRAAMVRINTELTRAKAGFDGSRASAQTYQAELVRLVAQLKTLGNSGTATAAQIGKINLAIAQAQREIQRLNTSTNLSGLTRSLGGALGGMTSSIGMLIPGLGPVIFLIQTMAGSMAAAGAAGATGAEGVNAFSLATKALLIGLAAAVIALIGTAVALAKSIDVAGEFEQKMADLKALTRPTAAEFHQLGDAALTVGRKFGYSARESADGMTELSRAGLNATQILGGGLKGAMTLAAAGGIDLGQAAKFSVTGMMAFGLAAKDLPHVADVYANFANKTVLGVSDLAVGLAAVGPVARNAGLNIEEMSGLLALAAQGGFKNMSDAGTSIKTMFLNLQAPTNVSKKLFKEIGIEIYDAAGKQRDMMTVVRELGARLHTMTDEQKNATMKTIGGSDAFRILSIVANDTKGSLVSLTKSMGENNEAERVATERTQTYQGSKKKLSAAFEGLGIAIGTKFLPFMTKVVDGMTRIVDWFTSGGLSVTNLTKKFPALGSTFKVVGELGRSFGQLVVAAFQLIVSIWETFLKPKLQVLLPLFVGVFNGIVKVVQIVLDEIKNFVKMIVALLHGDFKGAWEAVKSFVGDALNGIVDLFKGIGTAIMDSLNKLIPMMIEGGKKLINGVVDGVKSGISGLNETLTEFFANNLFGKAESDKQIAANQAYWAKIRAAGGKAPSGLGITPPPTGIKVPVITLSGALKSVTPTASQGASSGALSPQDVELARLGTITLAAFTNQIKSWNQAKLTQTLLVLDGNRADGKYASLLAEIKDREADRGKIVKLNSFQLAQLRIGIRSATDEQLKNALVTSKAAGDSAKYNIVLGEQQRRIKEGVQEAKKAQKQAASETDTRANLVREIRQSNDAFQESITAHSVSQKTIGDFSRKMEDYQSRVAKLPASYRAGIPALFSLGDQLKKTAQAAVTAKEAEVDRQKVEAINVQTQLSKKESAISATNSLIAEFARRKQIAGQSLADLLSLEKEYGPRILKAKNQGEITSGEEEKAKVRQQYSALLLAAVGHADRITQLQKALKSRLLSIDHETNTKIDQNQTDQQTALSASQKSFNDSQVSILRGSQRAISTLAVEALKEDMQARIDNQTEMLNSEADTAQQRLDILRQSRDSLIDAKTLEIRAIKQLEFDAEKERFDAAVKTATDLGVYTGKLKEKLNEEHQRANNAITLKYGNELKKFDLANQKAIILAGRAAQAEVTAGVKEEVSKRIESLDTFTGEQRDAAKATLLEWQATYEAMGEKGKGAVKEITAALITLDKANRKTVNSVSKMFDTPIDEDKIKRQLNKVGKAEDSGDARDKAAGAYDGLASSLKTDIETVQNALDSLSAGADAKLRQSLFDRIVTLKSYLTQTVTAATAAGEQAATEFVQNANDVAQKGLTDLAEVNKQIEEAASGGSFNAEVYSKALQADVTYWQQRLLSAKAGSAEYLQIAQTLSASLTKLAQFTKDQLAQSSDTQVKVAEETIKTLTEGIDNFSGKQRDAAIVSLTAWEKTFTNMGKAGEAAAKLITTALDGVKKSGTSAAEAVNKTLGDKFEPKEFKSKVDSVGKPDTLSDAQSKGAQPFASMIDDLKKNIETLKSQLGAAGSELSSTARSAASTRLTELETSLKYVTGVAEEAGKKAGQTFSMGLLDTAAEGRLALVEVAKQLAEAGGESGGGDNKYRLGLVAYKDYWQNRLAVLTAAGDTESEEYRKVAENAAKSQKALNAFDDGKLKDAADEIAKLAQLEAQRLGIELDNLDILKKAKKISDTAYWDERERLTLLQLDKQREAELSNLKLTAEEQKVIRAKYAQLEEKAKAETPEGKSVDTSKRLQDAAKFRSDSAKIELDGLELLHRQSLISEKDYLAKREKLTKDDLTAQFDSEMATVGLTEAMQNQIREKYRILRKAAELDTAEGKIRTSQKGASEEVALLNLQISNLEALKNARLISEKEFLARKEDLTLKSLKLQEDAELLSTTLTAKEREAIIEAYRQKRAAATTETADGKVADAQKKITDEVALLNLQISNLDLLKTARLISEEDFLAQKQELTLKSLQMERDQLLLSTKLTLDERKAIIESYRQKGVGITNTTSDEKVTNSQKGVSDNVALLNLQLSNLDLLKNARLISDEEYLVQKEKITLDALTKERDSLLLSTKLSEAERLAIIESYRQKGVVATTATADDRVKNSQKASSEDVALLNLQISNLDLLKAARLISDADYLAQKGKLTLDSLKIEEDAALLSTALSTKERAALIEEFRQKRLAATNATADGTTANNQKLATEDTALLALQISNLDLLKSARLITEQDYLAQKEKFTLDSLKIEEDAALLSTNLTQKEKDAIIEAFRQKRESAKNSTADGKVVDLQKAASDDTALLNLQISNLDLLKAARLISDADYLAQKGKLTLDSLKIEEDAALLSTALTQKEKDAIIEAFRQKRLAAQNATTDGKVVDLQKAASDDTALLTLQLSNLELLKNARLISEEDFLTQREKLTLDSLKIEEDAALLSTALTQKEKDAIIEAFRQKRLAAQNATTDGKEGLADQKSRTETTSMGLQLEALDRSHRLRLISTATFLADRLSLTVKKLNEEQRLELENKKLTDAEKLNIDKKYELARQAATDEFNSGTGGEVVKAQENLQKIAQIELDGLEFLHSQKLISESKYLTDKLALDLRIQAAQEAAELANTLLTDQEKTDIINKGILERKKLQAGNSSGTASNLQAEKTSQASLLGIQLDALELLKEKKGISEEEYIKERRRLLLEQLQLEMDAELASTLLTEEEKKAIRDKYAVKTGKVEFEIQTAIIERQLKVDIVATVKTEFSKGFQGGFDSLRGTVGNVASGFGAMLNPLGIFAMILEKINIVGTILDSAFAVLAPVIEAIQEPLKELGRMFGLLILPIAQLLIPIIENLSIVLNPFLEIMIPIVKLLADIWLPTFQILTPVLELLATMLLMFYDAIANIVYWVSFTKIDIRRKDTSKEATGTGKPKPDTTTSDPGKTSSVLEDPTKAKLADFSAGRISYQEFEQSRLDSTLDRINTAESAEIKAANRVHATQAELDAITDKYAGQRAAATEEFNKLILERTKGVSETVLAIDEATNERLFKAGTRSREDYEAEKLRITKARIENERIAELASNGKDPEKNKLTNQKFDGQILDAETKYWDEKHDRDVAGTTEETRRVLDEADKTNKRLYDAGLKSQEEYEKEKYRITLARIENERAAELAANGKDPEKNAATNQKYDTQRVDAEFEYWDTVEKIAVDGAKALKDRGLLNEAEYAAAVRDARLKVAKDHRDTLLKDDKLTDAQRLAIEQKYLTDTLNINQSYTKALSDIWQGVGDTISKNMRDAFSKGLKDAIKKGDFSTFKTDFKKAMGEIIFDAVMNSIVDNLLIAGIIQPAVDQLITALQTPGVADDEAAIQNLSDAGDRAVGMAHTVFTMLKPLKARLGVEDTPADGSQADSSTGGGDKSPTRIVSSFQLSPEQAATFSLSLSGFSTSLSSFTNGLDVQGMKWSAFSEKVSLVPIAPFSEALGRHSPSLDRLTLAIDNKIPLLIDAIDRHSISADRMVAAAGTIQGALSQVDWSALRN